MHRALGAVESPAQRRDLGRQRVGLRVEGLDYTSCGSIPGHKVVGHPAAFASRAEIQSGDACVHDAFSSGQICSGFRPKAAAMAFRARLFLLRP